MSREDQPHRGRLFRLPASRRSLQREVEEEIRFHLESRVDELVARGIPPARAREEALREFGDITASRVELAAVDRLRVARDRRAAWWEALRQDLGYSMRALRKQPGFSLVVVLILALGIGANATMFGIIDHLLLRPPRHVTEPSRLMLARTAAVSEGQEYTQDMLSYSIYQDFLRAGAAFTSVAAYARADLALGRGADARHARAMRVTANFFPTLGARPALGRFFLPDENGNPIAPDVVVLGHEFWQREFASDRAVIGREVTLGARRHTIVGVAPPRFTGVGDEPVDLWVPLTAGVSASEYAAWQTVRQWYWVNAVARLRPEMTRSRAVEVASASLHAGWERDGHSAADLARRRIRADLVSVLPRDARAGDPDSKVALLLGAVSLLVLLIACANVANLQLARAVNRVGEVALRIALGINRARLVRQLVSESVILGVGAGLAALAITVWGGQLVRGVLFTTVIEESVVDVRLVTYVVLASVATGVLSGFLPALQSSRPEIATVLRTGGRGAAAHRSRTRTTLLVVQAALSIVLLVGTGLFVRSLRRIEALPLGMEPGRVLYAKVFTAGAGYTAQEVHALYRRLEEAARATPGVERVALAVTRPFHESWAAPVVVPGRDSLPVTSDGGPYLNAVGDGFFETMGMRLLRGRPITAADRAGAPRVVVVNRTLADLWWPNEDPIGKCMKVGGDTVPCSAVVGVAENARRQSLLEDASVQYFVPLDYAPARMRDRVLFLRPTAEPARVAEALRQRLQASVPDLPYLKVKPLEEFISPQTRSWRLGSTVFGAFGVLALAVAALGLYSALAYDVSRRSHELAVRVALGARGRDVTKVVVGQALLVAVAGAAVGYGIALIAGRWVASLLFETSAREPLVFGAAGVMLVAVALLATVAPARKALRADPLTALRAG